MPQARRGIFITLEGGEGSGKTTLAGALVAWLEQRGHSVCLTQEPGGTAFGKAVRRLLSAETAPSPLAELLLFEADRAQHVAEVIAPALEAGRIVVCDRFTDSTLAYQGCGRGVKLGLIRTLNDAATGGLKPDITLLLDLPPEVGLTREGEQTDVTGRESLEFHERVREGFLAEAKREPGRFVIIDATLPEEQVAAQAWAVVEERL